MKRPAKPRFDLSRLIFPLSHKEKAHGYVDGVRYPSFHAKLVAAAIDLFIVYQAMILIGFPEQPAPEFAVQMQRDYNAGLLTEDEFIQQTKQYLLYEGGLAHLLAQWVTQFFYAGFIVVAFWIFTSATPGKHLMCMKIINVKDLSKPSDVAFIIRYLSYAISGICIGLGFVWQLFNIKHRGWHDYIAGTAVIYDENGWLYKKIFGDPEKMRAKLEQQKEEQESAAPEKKKAKSQKKPPQK